MNLLNSHSCLENIDLIEHNNEILEIINLLEGYYDYDCALVCKFQDELNNITDHLIQKSSEISLVSAF